MSLIADALRAAQAERDRRRGRELPRPRRGPAPSGAGERAGGPGPRERSSARGTVGEATSDRSRREARLAIVMCTTAGLVALGLVALTPKAPPVPGPIDATPHGSALPGEVGASTPQAALSGEIGIPPHEPVPESAIGGGMSAFLPGGAALLDRPPPTDDEPLDGVRRPLEGPEQDAAAGDRISRNPAANDSDPMARSGAGDSGFSDATRDLAPEPIAGAASTAPRPYAPLTGTTAGAAEAGASMRAERASPEIGAGERRTTAHAAELTSGPGIPDADEAAINEQEADRAFAQGLAAQSAGEPARAIASYERALRFAPNRPESANNLGLVRQTLRQFEGARDAFRLAIEIDPGYALAWSNLGVVLGILGQEEGARTALQRAVELEPGNTGARVNLALRLEAAGATEAAHRLLTEALQLDPGMAEAHYALARLLDSLGRAREAQVHYEHFLIEGRGRFETEEELVRKRMRELEDR